jgi:hypothetical protein
MGKVEQRRVLVALDRRRDRELHHHGDLSLPGSVAPKLSQNLLMARFRSE